MQGWRMRSATPLSTAAHAQLAPPDVCACARQGKGEMCTSAISKQPKTSTSKWTTHHVIVLKQTKKEPVASDLSTHQYKTFPSVVLGKMSDTLLQRRHRPGIEYRREGFSHVSAATINRSVICIMVEIQESSVTYLNHKMQISFLIKKFLITFSNAQFHPSSSSSVTWALIFNMFPKFLCSSSSFAL